MGIYCNLLLYLFSVSAYVIGHIIGTAHGSCYLLTERKEQFIMRTINITHGGYNVCEYEVIITQGMRDQALAFACKIKIDNNQFTRLLPHELQGRTVDNIIKRLKLEIQRTYVGKLGELAFLSLLNEMHKECDVRDMFTIYEGQENTDAFDFVTADGLSIDIKTGFRQNHSRLLINEQQFVNLPKDYYVGVKLNAQDVPGDNKLIYWDSVQTAIIKGYAEKTYLDTQAYRDFGEGSAKSLPYDRLLGIDRLLARFNDLNAF